MQTILKIASNRIPSNRYVKLPCGEKYSNDNFDRLLCEIGKHYFHLSELKLNAICKQIQISLNAEWHLNRWRHRDKKVSVMQIKTIRRSFSKMTNHDSYYIKIPFDIAPIFFYIINLAISIEDENSSIKNLLQEMDKNTICKFLYDYHLRVFNENFNSRIRHIEDTKMVARYEKLHANLNSSHSFMTDKISNMSKYHVDDYKLK